MSTSALVLSAPAAAQAAPKGPAAAPASAPSEASAVQAAKKYGKRVEVMSARTESSQIFAEPTGRLVYEATAVPQRVKNADGSWSDIDLNLAKGSDGSLAPATSTSDVRFSTGGPGPLVTLVQNGKKFTLTWPLGALPAPSVSGDAATYAEVRPGVDLVVHATATGFSHVVVVKNATAAADPAIRDLRFDLGGDATVTRLPDGTLRAAAGSEVLATAPEPQMWDSTTTAPAPVASPSAAAAPSARSAAPAADTRSNTRSSHAGPGDAARTADMATEIKDRRHLILHPDTKLIGLTTKFPVYLDPLWSTGKTRWAYATNNNSNNTDTSVARVGSDPDSGKIYRSFFEFPTTAIKGKFVRTAYVQMVVDHTWSCTKTPTTMWTGGSITTPRTPWSTALGTYLWAASSNANEGSGCSDSPQPDMTVNFGNDSGTTAVSNWLNTAAGKGSASVTVGFSARDSDKTSESDQTRWKKFFPSKAKLIADVDAKPGQPTSLQVSGTACNSTLTIGTTTPYFAAVLPDADGTTQTLKATWELYKAPVGQAFTAITAPAQTSTGGGKQTQSAKTSALTNGLRYAFRVYSTDQAPYNVKSPVSEYCFFWVDTSVPNVSITRVTPDADLLPGKPVKFTLSSTSTNVKGFNYGWTEAATSSVVPTTANGVTSATVTLSIPKYGTNILYVQAVNTAGSKGYGSADFTALRPSPSVARWPLEIGGPVDATSAVIDQQPSLAGDNQLTLSGTTWADKGRVIGAQNLAFNGSGVVTTPKFLDTTSSFSVGAWVRLENVTNYQTFISEDGTGTANFQLQFRPDDTNGDGAADKSWCFGLRPTDTSATTAFNLACSTNTAVLNRWTHVAGVYDAATKKVSVWVDGVMRAEAAAPATAWQSTGPLRIGNRKYSTTQYVDALYGSVADVQVFNRALVANDFSGKMASEPDSGGFDEPGIVAPTRVGKWDFESANPCYEAANETGLCDAPDAGSGWNQRINLTPGSYVGPGNQSTGLSLDDQHWIDDPSDPHYHQATREYGVVQRNTAPAGTTENWKDTPVLRTDQSFSVSVWVQPAKLENTMTAISQRGTYQAPFYLQTRKSTVDGVTGMRFEVMTVSADQTENEVYNHLIAPRVLTEDDTNDWFNLVFVYNAASSNQLRLYVNGNLEGTAPGVLWNAAGSMTVGGAWWSGDPTTGAMCDQWYGGIDDLEIFQGALTSGGVQALAAEEGEHTPPAAAWSLGDGSGTTAADTSPSAANPATLTNVSWGAGRLPGTQAATFNGSSSYATSPYHLNTSDSFTVSAWARLTAKGADRTIVTQDASGYSSLYLQYQASSDRWIAQMPSATSGSVTWSTAKSTKAPVLGKWTHVAAVFNDHLKTLTLYINGVAQSTVSNVNSFYDPNGATWIGRSGTTWFQGDLADVAMWDRPVTAGEIGELAAPTEVAYWALDETTGTVTVDGSPRQAAGTVLGGVTHTTPGYRASDPGAYNFNGTDAVVTAGKPLVRTDQSFTVAAWVRVTSNAHFSTAISQDGAHSTGFQLQWGGNCKCWEFAMPNSDAVNPGQVSVLAPGTAPLNTWTHLAGVYDAATATATLYVNGEAVATQAAPAAPWNATGPLTVGKTKWNDVDSDWFAGDIDDVHIYQGALSKASIVALADPTV
ncbi:LamG domain-containing protein [Actinoplanes oblitus]|uniref:LamG domain-containing protein n=1 Tax=Actinoplanes oblitus TaxID=3040509 RepID=A0ABY8WJU5_9ACTN|nr:LamG domain-containing protein [Actinoplanes oblitus]WIM97336.1 LamG domain-containing protein [Actinoplanes oblitus]